MWKENVLTPDLGATNHSEWFAEEEKIYRTFFDPRNIKNVFSFHAAIGPGLQLYKLVMTMIYYY